MRMLVLRQRLMCIWVVSGLTMGSVWVFCEFSVSFLRVVCGLSVSFLRVFCELSVGCLWVDGPVVVLLMDPYDWVG